MIKRDQAGFTFIEALLAVAILGVLSIGVFPALSKAIALRKEAKMRSIAAKTIERQMEQLRDDARQSYDAGLPITALSNPCNGQGSLEIPAPGSPVTCGFTVPVPIAASGSLAPDSLPAGATATYTLRYPDFSCTAPPCTSDNHIKAVDAVITFTIQGKATDVVSSTFISRYGTTRQQT